MEDVREVKMTLLIQTNKRTVEQEFENVFDLRIFLDKFFSEIAPRKSKKVKDRIERAKSRLQA